MWGKNTGSPAWLFNFVLEKNASPKNKCYHRYPKINQTWSIWKHPWKQYPSLQCQDVKKLPQNKHNCGCFCFAHLPQSSWIQTAFPSVGPDAVGQRGWAWLHLSLSPLPRGERRSLFAWLDSQLKGRQHRNYFSCWLLCLAESSSWFLSP